MEPQQARLTFAAALMLTAMIVFNAIYLQSDSGVRHSLQNGLQKEHVSAGQKIGRYILPGLHSQKSQDSDLVRAIRRELFAKNYFPGQASGHKDASLSKVMLRGAIMAYQYDRGLALTGLASDDLLKSFLFGVPLSPDPQSRPLSSSAKARGLIAQIQGILSATGHYQGKIDGVFKRQSAQAVERFESEQGLPVTGRISGLLVQELTRVTGIQFSS